MMIKFAALALQLWLSAILCSTLTEADRQIWHCGKYTTDNSIGISTHNGSYILPLPAVTLTHRSAKDVEMNKENDLNGTIELELDLLQDTLPLNQKLSSPRTRDHLMRKLRCHEDVHVMVLGGSFTKGAGTGRTHERAVNSWPARFIYWLQAAYPKSKMHLHNECQGSTTSFYGAHRLHQVQYPIDILLVDYSVNDYESGAREIAGGDPKKLLHATEVIIRRVFKVNKYALVVYLSVLMTNMLPEEIYQQVCDVYGVPILSYRRSVYEVAVACSRHNTSSPHFRDGRYCRHLGYYDGSTLWAGRMWDVHPDERTHRLVAQTVAFYFTRLVEIHSDKQLRNKSVAEDIEVDIPPRPVFNSNNISALQKHHMDFETCTNPMTYLSSIGTDDGAIDAEKSFAPYNPSHSYLSGWNFTQDRPGKPFGWISGSKFVQNNASTLKTGADLPALISFRVLIINGTVSITYLSTYENSGIFQAYIGCIDYDSNGGIEPSWALQADALRCCNKSSLIRYPNYKKLGVSTSRYIDTLHSSSNFPSRRISEVKVVTLRVGYHGNFLLNLQHVPLSREELMKRGGDKVKILGISSC